MIEIIGPALNQWDTGRVVHITGIEAEYAHFANKGDAKAVIMELVDSQAKIPDYLFQTGKQLCVYAVKDGITVGTRTFYVQKRERPENYVYEDDQRNYIYELIQNAQTAADNATAVAQELREAKDSGEFKGDPGEPATDDQVAAAVEAYMEEHPVEVPDVDMTGVVKSVNGIAPDENGNVEIEAGGSGGAGADGFSPVASVTQTNSGAVITITDKGGTTTATVTNGKDGATGEKGDQGIQGETGAKGDKGDTGANGKDGVSATHRWNGTTLTITSASGTSSANLKGDKGDKGDTGATGPAGANGKDGTSVTVKSVSESTADGGSNVVTFSDGKTITIKNGSKGSTGATGATGATGPKPVKGTDYWTAADQEAIVQQVIAALGTPVFGRVDADNNIILTGELADGAYTVKYEDADGNVVDVGTIVKAKYINRADPTSQYWLTDMRLNSTNVVKDFAGSHVTNFIPCKVGDVIRVKGLDIRNYGSGDGDLSFVRFYSTENGSVLLKTATYQNANFVNSGDVWTYTVAEGVSGSVDSIAFVRFNGMLYSGYTKEDVIITVNQEID